MKKEKNVPLEKNLQQLVKRSDVVFEGVVIAVEGDTTDHQIVRYRIDQVLKGDHDATEIAVDHAIASHERIRAGDPSHPPIAPNAWLIVSARKASNGTWMALDENYSALPATPEWSEKIEAALQSIAGFHK